MVRCLMAGLPYMATAARLIALGAVAISFSPRQPWREANTGGSTAVFALASRTSDHSGLQDHHQEGRERVLEATEEKEEEEEDQQEEEMGPSLDISRVGSPRSNGCADFDLSVLLKGRGCKAPLSEPCFNLDR